MILVTGGTGFIGSVLIAELNRMGFNDILIVDRLGTGPKWKNLRGLKYSDIIHVDNFYDMDMEQVFAQVEMIYHIGACSSTTQTNADYLWENNTQFSKNMFLFATQHEIPLIYASSAATYGDGECGYDDDHDQIDQLRPLNMYGYSKQAFDQWVLAQSDTPPVWIGLKFFNVYGPNEYHKDEQRSIVHKSFEQIRDAGKVRLFKSHRQEFKDGEQLRDFVYVLDVVKAMLMMGQQAQPSQSGIYNMGHGKGRSFKDLVTAVFKSMGKKVDIEYIDMPESIRHQYQYFTQANMQKFHSQFPGFEFCKLEYGVRDYVENYLLKDSYFPSATGER